MHLYVYTLLKVVSHYGLIVLSVMAFQKNVIGVGASEELCPVVFDFWIIINNTLSVKQLKRLVENVPKSHFRST